MHHKGYKNRAFGVWTRGKRLFRSNRARCEVHRVCWNRSVCGRGVAAMLPSVNSQILIPAECPNARAPRAPVLRHAEAGSNAGIVPEPKTKPARMVHDEASCGETNNTRPSSSSTLYTLSQTNSGEYVLTGPLQSIQAAAHVCAGENDKRISRR